MDWPAVILLIVVIGAITSIIQTRIQAGNKPRSFEPDVGALNGQGVLEEMRALRARVAVLERIATDKNNLLEQEFERLRDR